MVKNKEIKELLGRKYCGSCDHFLIINYVTVNMSSPHCDKWRGMTTSETEACFKYESKDQKRSA